jgi:hypothetical protein
MDVLPIFLAVVLLGVVLLQSQQLRRSHEIQAWLSQQGMDLRRVDALVGSRLPGATAGGEQPEIVWILDPRGCTGCLGGVGEWNDLSTRGRLTRIVVVNSTRAEAARLKAGHRIQGIVEVDQSGEFRELLGTTLSSLKLLIDEDGTIRRADPRKPADCRISFEAVLRDHDLRS